MDLQKSGALRLSRRAAMGLLAAPAVARAQGWPNGPIRVVVPVPPGGSIDAVARLAAPGLQAALGVPIVIENRGGGAGSLGTGIVAKAPADGQTWLITFDWHPMMNALIPGLNFDIAQDFVSAKLIGTVPYLLVTKPDKPFRSLGDVITAAKARPDSITFASTGSGTLGHLAMTLLGAKADAKLVHVGYRGGGPALADTLGGTVDLMVGSAALLAPQVAGGRLRAVSQTGSYRIPSLPNLPTMSEDGYDVVANAWWGYFAPRGTPQAAIERFGAALDSAFADPRVREQMTQAQQARMLMQGPAELDALVERERTIWTRVIRDHHIAAD